MPDQPSWIERVPEIQRALERMPGEAPWLDRASVERLFGLSARQSVRLMRGCAGAVQVGRSLLVPRVDLLRLVGGAEGRGVEERRRRQRLHEVLGVARVEAGRRAIPIPDVRLSPERVWGDLPGVRLRPGRLEVEFQDVEELLRRLFELSQAIADDYGEFERLAGGG